MKHPILFFSEEDIRILRNKTKDTSRNVFRISGTDMWKVIKHKADEYCNEQYLIVRYPN